MEKNLYVSTKDPIEIFTDESGQRVKVTTDNVFQNTSGTKVGINESQVFTPPYTLTGLLSPAGLEATVGGAATALDDAETAVVVCACRWSCEA